MRNIWLHIAFNLLLSSTAVAGDRTGIFINKLMTATKICEVALGGAHYQAARAMGVQRLGGGPEANQLIASVDRRLSVDPRMPYLQDNATASGCLKVINDLYFEYGDL